MKKVEIQERVVYVNEQEYKAIENDVGSYYRINNKDRFLKICAGKKITKRDEDLFYQGLKIMKHDDDDRETLSYDLTYRGINVKEK